MIISEIRKHNGFSIDQKYGKKQYARGPLTKSLKASRLHNPLPILDGRLDLSAKTLQNARKMTRRGKLDQRLAWEQVLAEMEIHDCDFNWVTRSTEAVFTAPAVEEIIKRFSV